MTADFYTNVICEHGQIYYRGISAGQRVVKKYNYNPKLYIKSNRNTGWKTLKGDPLEEQVFNSISEARNFVKKYKEVPNFRIFGNQRYEYGFISDAHPGAMDVDYSKIVVANIDIEVMSNQGFPQPDRADHPITAITVSMGGIYHVYGYGSIVFTNNDPKVIYQHFENEIQLLQKFLDDWDVFMPDIVTGWNIEIFDIPYLVNRIAKLMDEDQALRLSPWKRINHRTIKQGDREDGTYDILGIGIIDYIQLYKKYSMRSSMENYQLETIAQFELGEGKVDYKTLGYKNLNDLYQRNYQLYIEYNIQDVALIDRIEEKMKLMSLVMTLAYQAKVNFEDVFSQVRMWDMIIYNKLKGKKIAIPPSLESIKSAQYEGGFVKPVRTGKSRWLASFDLTSLYPHLIMQYNISPETLVDPSEYDSDINEFLFKYGAQISVETLLAKQIPLDWMKAKNITLTPNGQFFRTDVRGFLPELMEEIFGSRSKFKSLQKDSEKSLEKTLDEEAKKELVKLIASYGALQQALKVTLNSAYGAIGNKYFRFFDVRIAEGITMAGQLSAQWVAEALNDYLNSIIKPKREDDYIIASDTDSIYVTFEALVKKVGLDETKIESVIDFLDKVCEQKIKPFIDKSYEKLADYVNAYEQKMVMKREALADVGIWTGKKHYILSVWDNEGVRYSSPKIKIVGLEAIKSTTPNVCKKKIKDAIGIMLTGNEDDLIDFIDKFRQEFTTMKPSAIARPSGCNGLDTYSDKRSIYATKTPIHVRAALLFNHHLKDRKLTDKYELIKEGEKMKYLYMKIPNPIRENVFGFSIDLPPELELEPFIDYNTQYDKVFISPVKAIMDVIGWRLEKTSSLEDLFG